MADRKTAKQATMGFEDDPPPEEVQEAADEYVAALTKANKARGNLNTAKDNVIDLMKLNKISRLKVQNGAKILELSVNEKVLLKKVKEPSAAVDDGDDE